MAALQSLLVDNPIMDGSPQPLKAWYGVSSGLDTNGYAYIEPANKGDSQTVIFDSHLAMFDLGRTEASN